MAEGAVATVAKALVDSVPSLLIFFGVVVLLLGLAGGVTYHQWLPLPEPSARIAAGIAGAILISAGVWRSQTASFGGSLLRASAFGITITEPRNGESVSKPDVRGKIKKALPQGYSLRVFRIYPGPEERLTPLAQASVDMENEVWEAPSCDIGGNVGEQRGIGVYLVGPAGLALLDYVREATKVHNATMDEPIPATPRQRTWLPAIHHPTPHQF